jgi:hypothetical protein
VYPALYYPEVYLLHLGYKEFFSHHPDLCTGRYTTMVDPNHEVSYFKLKNIFISVRILDRVFRTVLRIRDGYFRISIPADFLPCRNTVNGRVDKFLKIFSQPSQQINIPVPTCSAAFRYRYVVSTGIE